MPLFSRIQIMPVVQQRLDSYEIVNLLPLHASMLEFQLQAMAAYFAAPGWRTDGWERWIATMNGLSAAADADPQQLYGVHAAALLHGDDMRWRRPTPEDRAAWTAQEAIEFMRPLVDTAPIEVIVVGDASAEAVIALVARTFGALPARRPLPEPADLRAVRFPLGSAETRIVHHFGPADSGVVAVHWAASDALSDPRAAVAGQVLGHILSARVSRTLREEEGKTYATRLETDFSTALPGYGTLGVALAVDPEDASHVLAALQRIGAELAAGGIREEEFELARTAQRAGTKANLRSNGYWATILSGAHAEPRTLARATRAAQDLERLTLAEVQALAAAWMRADRAVRILVVPPQ